VRDNLVDEPEFERPRRRERLSRQQIPRSTPATNENVVPRRFSGAGLSVLSMHYKFQLLKIS
jgi:hypothetical protein